MAKKNSKFLFTTTISFFLNDNTDQFRIFIVFLILLSEEKLHHLTRRIYSVCPAALSFLLSETEVLNRIL